MIVVGIDQSLVCTGLAALELRGGVWVCRETSVVRTKPDAKATHLYKADQDGMRIDDIADGVVAFLRRQPKPRLVAMEAPAGAQSASAAKALGLAYGTVRTAVRMAGDQPIVVQAHHAKKAAAGLASATKDEVIAAMRARWMWRPEGAKPVIEAMGDALAVATCALEEPTVRAMTSAHERSTHA